ncbi:MAG: helix-turn-helix domain-containing protein, partial [Eubacteriaceae bacterium]|nr:helix-turn-helix domain-containing protein [Eubacteriaceae bacterium]
ISQGCEYGSVMDLNNSADDLTQAKALILQYFGADDIMLQSLMQRDCLNLRAQMVLYLKQHTNLSIRKIAEVLNLNRGIVYKIICDNIKD